MLINKPESSKITLHYDTMSKSWIGGEWLSLIINAIDDNPLVIWSAFNHCSLHLRIANKLIHYWLIIETLKRLSTKRKGHYSPQMLWEQFGTCMTDSVSKNLQVEYEVAKQLISKHIPIHLLCKSQLVKNLMQQTFQY